MSKILSKMKWCNPNFKNLLKPLHISVFIFYYHQNRADAKYIIIPTVSSDSYLRGKMSL